MRPTLVGVCIVVSLAAFPCVAPAQLLSLDARKVGLGGLDLHRGGALSRYNAAYRAVPDKEDPWHAKLTIPIPLGIIQALKDSTVLHPDSPYFNPLQAANYLLDLPIFLEVKKVPAPTNDIAFGIGKDSFSIDLGKAKSSVPVDPFGFGGSSRPIDLGFGIKGFRASAMLWIQDEVDFQLGPRLIDFLHNGQPAQTNTLYDATGSALAAGGFAPSLGWAGRISGKDQDGVFVGVTGHYYLGLAYGQATSDGGFITGDTLFGGTSPVTPSLGMTTQYSKLGHKMGTGIGADMGVVWVNGPLEAGFGINDVGAKITWPDTRIDTLYFDSSAAVNSTVSRNLQNHVQTTTKLPVTYVANAALDMGGGTMVGGEILHGARGTEVHMGVEQHFGPLALRGGIARDQQKRVQFGWGGGVRFLFLSLDVGFATHSTPLSDQRGVTMATSLSIY
ncbi:MAG TPA: hypothetical protein VEV39_09880 [Gemmatimonadales bacterium]|nr:hypothetical protein [Gemmatimonadales bacterium]